MQDSIKIPSRNLTKARVLKILGWIIIFIGIILFILFIEFMNSFILSLIIGVGLILIRKGKQYSVERGHEVLKKDIRPPIVYLRTFHDDDLTLTTKQLLLKLWNGDKESEKRKNLSKYIPFDNEREQRALARVFQKVGPYVALGKPGEPLPELGSLKLYVGNGEWQETILNLLQNSRLVIFNAGKSESLRWELNQIVKSVNPSKVLLILPIRDDIYFDFVLWANEIFPCQLPEELPSERLVIFNDNWTPKHLNNQKTLTSSLQPYFQKNGITIKEGFFDSLVEFNDWV